MANQLRKQHYIPFVFIKPWEYVTCFINQLPVCGAIHDNWQQRFIIAGKTLIYFNAGITAADLSFSLPTSLCCRWILLHFPLFPSCLLSDLPCAKGFSMPSWAFVFPPRQFNPFPPPHPTHRKNCGVASWVYYMYLLTCNLLSLECTRNMNPRSYYWDGNRGISVRISQNKCIYK